MPLPAHLQRFDALIELIVASLVRQCLGGKDLEVSGAITAPPRQDHHQRVHHNGHNNDMPASA